MPELSRFFGIITRIYRVKSLKRLAPYTLRICFDDETEQTIDFQPVLAGELYGPLQDPVAFDQVSTDSEVHTLVWPNGADFGPALLHDWPVHQAEFVARARQWGATGEKDRISTNNSTSM